MPRRVDEPGTAYGHRQFIGYAPNTVGCNGLTRDAIRSLSRGSLMPDPKKPFQPVSVSCEICLKEVPNSEAQSAEANDYVLYFCGLECYDKWRQEFQKEQEAAAEKSR
jgi:hypothetical protein